MTEREKLKSGEGGEISSCLIGKFHDIKSLQPQRFLAVEVGDGVTCSLDMLRLRLKFFGDSGVRLDEKAGTFQCDDYRCFTARGKVGGWRYLHKYGIGKTSLVIGIGHIAKETDMGKGFVEFNPNKLAETPEFWNVWCGLSKYVGKSEVARYDLAVDVAKARDTVRLKKDRRVFQLNQSATLTEYLGRRDSAGFVKVYDKAAESELKGPDGEYVPLTRVEMTCDGSWGLEKIESHWPCVYALEGTTDGLKGTTRALATMLAEKVDAGGFIEDYMAMLDYRTREKMRKAIGSSVAIKFPDLGASEVRKQAEDWSKSLLGLGMFADFEKWVPAKSDKDETSGD